MSRVPKSPAAMLAAGKSAVFMEMAHTLAVLGTCDRKQVGAIIIRDGRCISWGFNGAPPGLPHCDETTHGWAAPYGDMLLSGAKDWARRAGCKWATHAEANALAFAAKQGISTDDAELYVTLAPCETCARLLIAAGITKVIYEEPYRDRSGLDLLERAGIELVGG